MRYARLALHLFWGALTVACAYPFLSDAPKRWLKQRWSRQLLEILGVRFQANFQGLWRGGLFVANHISWLDIFVLNAARPMAFVAKSEVRGWPLFGWLAAHTETIFLQRERRGDGTLFWNQINVGFRSSQSGETHAILVCRDVSESVAQAESLRAAPISPDVHNTLGLGLVLYDRYVLMFQLAGLVLLVAMIGAIVLTMRHRKDVKRQNVLQQMWRDPAKAMELRDVKPGQGL